MEKQYTIIVNENNIPHAIFVGNETEAKAEFFKRISQFDEIKKLEYEHGYAYECKTEDNTIIYYLSVIFKY
jgi:hypothetical protein